MAWTAIDNALVAVGAKPFASTLRALRDNFAGMAAGDSGAPRVTTTAMGEGTTAGDVVVLGLTGGAYELPAGQTRSYSLRAIASGTVRIYGEATGSGGGASSVTVDKNSGTPATAVTSAGSWTTGYTDVAVVPGDVLTVTVVTGASVGSVRRVQVRQATSNLLVI